MTRRERLEAKAAARREWASKASARAKARFDGAAKIADGIPMGQPILVGHHSERRHRRDAEKIHTNMRKGCEETKLARHHAARASGIEIQLENTIFSDDPDALEALKVKFAKLEAERAEIKDLNARCRKGDPEAIAKAQQLCRHTADDPRKGLPRYKLTNLGSEIRRVQARIVEVEARHARAAAVAAAGGVLVTIHGEYCQVTFEEKPERSVLDALRGAGFSWGRGSWTGRHEALPAEVRELVRVEEPSEPELPDLIDDATTRETADMIWADLDAEQRESIAISGADADARRQHGTAVCAWLEHHARVWRCGLMTATSEGA